MPPQTQNRAAAAIANMAMRLKQHEAQLTQLTALQKATADAPKWIEQIPGRRVPYWGVIDLPIIGNSTSKVDGIYNVSEDGPYVVTGIGMFYKLTTGDAAGVWGYATAAGSRIPAALPSPGFLGILDQPHVTSGSVRIVDRGSDRNWQNKPVASALFSPEAGGIYVLPVACLFDRNSAIEASFQPGLAVAETGLVECVLCGYKIVQGQSYQP
jgi:hypothetical protein